MRRKRSQRSRMEIFSFPNKLPIILGKIVPQEKNQTENQQGFEKGVSVNSQVPVGGAGSYRTEGTSKERSSPAPNVGFPSGRL